VTRGLFPPGSPTYKLPLHDREADVFLYWVNFSGWFYGFAGVSLSSRQANVDCARWTADCRLSRRRGSWPHITWLSVHVFLVPRNKATYLPVSFTLGLLGRDAVLSEATKYSFVRSCEIYVNKILISLKIPQFVIISARSHIQCHCTINAHKFRTED